MTTAGSFQLRPRRLGELLDLPFLVYRQRMGAFASFGIVLTLVMFAVGLAWQVFVFSFVALDPAGVPDLAAVGAMIASIPVLGLLRALALGCGAMLFVATVEDIRLGRRSSWREILRRALPRMPVAALTAVITGLVFLVGLAACLLPGLFVAIAFGLAVPAVYLERQGAFGAITRSWELVPRRGAGGMTTETNWVRVFVVLFVTVVVLYALYGLASVPIVIAQGAAQLSGAVPTGTMLGPQVLPLSLLIPLQLVVTVIQGLFFPLGVIPWVMLYYDIRTRHEGIDLEYRLGRLRGASTAGPGA